MDRFLILVSRDSYVIIYRSGFIGCIFRVSESILLNCRVVLSKVVYGYKEGFNYLFRN